MNDSAHHNARDRVEHAISRASAHDITPRLIDEIVLSATGRDQLIADVFESADRTKTSLAHATYAKGENQALGCVGLLAALAAIAAASGILARYGQSLGWTWLPPILSPVVAGLTVIIALASVRGPVGNNAARGSTIALALLLIADGVTLAAPGLKQWEMVAMIASLAVSLVSVVWINVVRARNADKTRALDQAFLQSRREARAALAGERTKAIDEVRSRFDRAGVDVAELDALWQHAASHAEQRGVSGLSKVDGPVGASKLTSILDIPRDHHDIDDAPSADASQTNGTK